MSLSISGYTRHKILLGGMAVGLCICIFFAYRILYAASVSEYAKEFTAGCIGAVITIFATAALLKSQNKNDVTKDQLAGVFKEKLQLYKEFIHFLNAIKTDGEIDRDEIRAAVEWGGTLSLVCRPGVIRILYEYIFQLLVFGTDNYQDLTDAQQREWRRWMQLHYHDMESEFQDEVICRHLYSSQSRMISMLRDDLASTKVSDEEENMDMQYILDDLFSLHSAGEVKFSADGSIEIEQVFDLAPKKKARRTKSIS